MNVPSNTRPRSNTDTRVQSPQAQVSDTRKRSSSQGNQPLKSSNEDDYSPSNTFEMGKYKTKLCRHWKTGYCLFGPSCVFAHGVDDLCEPNLLVQQMGGLVLVPVNMNGYAPVPMPYGGDTSNNANSGNSVPQSSSPTNGGLFQLPIFPYMPPSMTFTQGGTFQMVNQMPFYPPYKKDNNHVDHGDHVCVLCSESLDGPKPKAFLPCMHEFHEDCIQNPEKNIMELGCPSCPSSSGADILTPKLNHKISTPKISTPTLSHRQPTEISAE